MSLCIPFLADSVLRIANVANRLRAGFERRNVVDVQMENNDYQKSYGVITVHTLALPLYKRRLCVLDFARMRRPPHRRLTQTKLNTQEMCWIGGNHSVRGIRSSRRKILFDGQEQPGDVEAASRSRTRSGGCPREYSKGVSQPQKDVSLSGEFSADLKRRLVLTFPGQQSSNVDLRG